jgi:hypothetical protein
MERSEMEVKIMYCKGNNNNNNNNNNIYTIVFILMKVY